MQKGLAREIFPSVDAPAEVNGSALLVHMPVYVSICEIEKESNQSRSNEDVLDNLHKVDEEAFNAIYDKYIYQLISFARQLLDRKEDAEDVVADVFVNLWNLRDRFFTIQNIKAFLYASVRNTCINILKRAQIRRMNFLKESEESAEIPDQILIEVEYKKWLRTEIDRLPDQRKKILTLAIYEGKKTNEIAEILNIAPKTVSNQKKAAFETIRPRIRAITTTLFSIISIIIASNITAVTSL
ncbi:MAG: hypothetical protein BGO55_23600 [Sphingobacteriales bacterium 50-39]|nr:RNA polymerase sigma-70 factor [Sphingobacteriales bacterium]OJW58287.1 MAG: hypothetical protein BGO55_23600 [Sphingobacteriales bacterium 50-39]